MNDERHGIGFTPYTTISSLVPEEEVMKSVRPVPPEIQK